MKYIESKLNPDGTYDHSEVIEAVRNSAHLDFLHPTFEEWEPIGDPTWACYIKYRAVIEDKSFIKQRSDVIKNISAESDIPDFDEERLSDLVYDKFQSGNDIPVERITLTRVEVSEVFPGLLK